MSGHSFALLGRGRGCSHSKHARANIIHNQCTRVVLPSLLPPSAIAPEPVAPRAPASARIDHSGVRRQAFRQRPTLTELKPCLLTRELQSARGALRLAERQESALLLAASAKQVYLQTQ